MLRKPLSLLLLLAVSPVSGEAAAAEEFTLRFRPDAGAKLDVLMLTEQDTNMEMGPMGAQKMKSEVRMESTQTALGETESGASRMQFSFDRMALSMKSGDIEMMSLDTDEGETADPSLEAIGAMIGKPYVVEIDRFGGIVATEGLSELLDQVLDATPNPQAQAILEQAFSEESMLQSMQLSMPVFPKEALGIGDAWSRDLEWNLAVFGTVKIEATYTVEGLSEFKGEPCVRLGAEMLLEFEFNAPMLEQLAAASGSETEIQMDADDASASGWMCIARSDGVTLESEVENHFTMRIAVAAAGAGAEPMEIRMVLDQVTRQTVERSER